jgi:hypothetical protein
MPSTGCDVISAGQFRPVNHMIAVCVRYATPDAVPGTQTAIML